MAGESPILLWFRRDLRLADNAALSAAAASGRPVVPVFICDELVEALGAAPRWRLGLGVERLGTALGAAGSRLICRRGPAQAALQRLLAETGAGAVYWTRTYDPPGIDRDKGVKKALQAAGIEAKSFGGHLLFEPRDISPAGGGFYKVYTPFWRALRGREVAAPLPAPPRLRAPAGWPAGDDVAGWRMAAAMGRGAAVVRPHLAVGEEAAQDRLAHFLAEGVGQYGRARDVPAQCGTSRLSENLSCGEISVRTVWHAARRAMHEGAQGAEPFLRQLAWREFAWHLLYHTPHLAGDNWRPGWERFPWREDPGMPEILAWKQGRTGAALVDAGMREMYVTGSMHNRARMVAASYLTKHLLVHWRVGMDWFAECLADWDPAANALGWQWVAGCGPDAAPYFRIFNPDTQGARFDPDGAYARAWLAEGHAAPSATALSFYEAVPRSWGLSPQDRPPVPLIELAEGRRRALAAWADRDF